MKAVQCVKEFIAGDDRAFDSAHASTLLELDNGCILAAWFGGSREGAGDVAIWVSRRISGNWEVPRIVADTAGTAMWNPVLFRRLDGTILLFFKVGETIPGWRTFVVESRDEGQTFSAMQELVQGDASGGRGPVKNKPIRLKNGTVLAPASAESSVWDAFADISKDDGRTWEKSALVPVRRAGTDGDLIHRPYEEHLLYGKGIIQPTLWEDAEGVVHMLVRSTSSRIFSSESKDGGYTWSLAKDTGLPNNNSGIDLAQTENGTLVLAYNPRENVPGMFFGPRTPLCLAVSRDNGRTFENICTLEDGVGHYAYPSVICMSDQTIGVTYTWNRQTIVFASIRIEK